MPVSDPASRSWSPARRSGARGPAGALSTAERKDLALNLSAVHENIRGRTSKRFRNWFRVQASGSVRYVLLGVRLRRTPSSSTMSPVGYSWRCSPAVASASPTSSMVVQFSVEVNRKDEPSLSRSGVIAVVKTGRNAGVLFRR